MKYEHCHTQEKIGCPYQFMSRPMRTDGTHDWFYACKNEDVNHLLKMVSDSSVSKEIGETNE